MFQCLKIILSDFAFFILSFTFDFMLIKFINNSIKQSSIRSANHKAKLASKKRIIKMIILNVINFFFLKLPLVLMDFAGLFFNLDNQKQYKPDLVSYLICRGLIGFCDSLKAVFICFYLFSYLIQFFVFYKLDSNFKHAIKFK